MEKIENIIERFQMAPYLLYDAIVESTDDYIYIIDMKRDEALLSENMASDFAFSDRLVYGLVPAWGQMIHERDRALFFDSIDRMLCGETDEHNIEYQVQNRKGEYVWVICRGSLKRDEAGIPILFAGVVSNLGTKGKVDPITGLFTQLECEKKVQKLLELQEKDEPGGILLLGMDNFTNINVLNNHIFGDMVLRSFAQKVQNYLPEGAEIFRFDGDQFAVVFRGLTVAELQEFYGRLHSFCSRRQSLDGISYYCTVSAGIAMIGEDADNYLNLIKYASSALAVSKESGKNTCTVFSSDLIQSRLRMRELENQLQISVADEMRGFQLVYQPILRADNLETHDAEALLRWSCERLGAVSPVEFIPVLEATGLIVPVGRWVLEEAVKVCKEWSAVDEYFVVNINVSYLQMLEEGFLLFLESLLHRYELNPRNIMLEMTESYFVTDMDVLQNSFQTLRNMGILIAMDDFGTGYSSLGMLTMLPADWVKIDRAFISMIDQNPFNQSFIGSVIKLCHSVSIRVCVEGVEREEELLIVRSLEADRIQGFYFSQPVQKAVISEKFLC